MLSDWAGMLGGADTVAAMVVACALSFSWIGLTLKGQGHYLWMSVGLLSFAMGWGFSLSLPPPSRHASPDSVGWLALMLVGLSVIWTGLARHYAPSRKGLGNVVALTIAWVNALVGAVWLALTWEGGEKADVVVVAVVMLQTLVMAALGLFAARTEPGVGHGLSALWLVVFAVLGMYQIELHGHQADLPYVAMLPLLGMYISVLPTAYMREHRRLTAEFGARQAAEADLLAAGVAIRERSNEFLDALRAARTGKRAQARIVALAGDEVQSSLTVLRGCLDLLRGEGSPRKRKLLIDQACQSADQLPGLFGSILSHARLDNKRTAVMHSSTLLRQRLLDRVPHWQQQAQSAGLTVTAGLQRLNQAALVDVDVLLRLVDELMASAIGFTDGTTLALEACISDAPTARLELTVSDSGTPLSPERQSALFEPFEQDDTSNCGSPARAGGGLGLAIARSTARRLGGELGFSSVGGQGNSFKLILPAAPPLLLPPADASSLADAPPPAPQGERPGPSQGDPEFSPLLQNKRVLVVDDNAIMRMVLGIMLKKDGARPVECQDGAEAVRVVGLEPIDAVLMDISMPGMNGLEATRHIRRLHDGIQMNSAQGRRLPIIGISAHALAEDQQLCLEAGMTALVCKPIDWPLLRRTLQDVLA